MKISIITVCLNSKRTIEQTIKSVIGQAHDNCEYIIIDGGSTDGTLEILNKYDESISTIISELDEGIYDAMNKGIALATGDIIGILNSDDWYEPGIFKLVEESFRETNADIIYGKLNVFKENGEKETAKEINIEKLRYEMTIPHPTVFVRRAVYTAYGAFEQKYKISADYELMLRLYTKGVKFYFLDKTITNFRRGGISEQQGRQAEEETLRIARKYLACAPLRNRRYLKILLDIRRRALYFEQMIDDFPYALPELLISESGVGRKEDIVIFGAGKWGIKAYDALLQGGMCPLFLVDNNMGKWNHSDGNRTVRPPERLKTYQGVLLILVREFSTEILRQVEEYQNPDIYCITWNDIIDSYIRVKGMGTAEDGIKG